MLALSTSKTDPNQQRVFDAKNTVNIGVLFFAVHTVAELSHASPAKFDRICGMT